MENHGYAAFGAKEELKPHQWTEKEVEQDQVILKITHCGICHSDLHLIDNDWKTSQYPLVPGHEVIGQVVALGSRVKHLAVGDLAGVGWQADSCGHCSWCRQGEENLCQEHQPTCVGRPGGFAQSLVVPSDFAFKIPAGLDPAHAAPLLCAGITVYSPLREAEINATKKVGVIGIGGLGHLALQFARSMGAEVVAFSRTKEKEKEALYLGAHRLVSTQDKAEMKSVYGSLDLILNTAYAPLDWKVFLNCLKPKGRLVFLGAPLVPMEITPMHLLNGQKAISGSVIGGVPRIMEMLNFAARHQIQAQVEVFPFAEVNQALARVRSDQARYRVVLEM